MSVTIHLRPETERRLAEQAARQGLTLPAYLERLAEREASETNGAAAAAGGGIGLPSDAGLAPFRQEVAHSGMSDEELEAFFNEARDEAWRASRS
jgi:hypothetical protein